MKNILFALALLIGGAFAQYKYTIGGFHKELTFANASNYVQIGQLPPNAFVQSIRLYNTQTAADATTNTLFSVGIVSSTNYFVNAAQGSGPNAWGVEQTFGNVSNAGKILSTTAPIPIYVRFVYQGVAGASNFKARIAVQYLQL